MIKKLLLWVVLATPFTNTAQIINESIKSSKLGETRELKIQLPRNYEEKKEKHYPVMIVLDGDYLFEPIAGNVDYSSYWEDAPEMIVVGINQNKTRNSDAMYDDQNFLPVQKGADFFEFIGMELLQYIDEKYRTAPFHIIAGHDYTANFINYYLMKSEPVFDAYINLSPDLAPEMVNRITNSLSKSTSKKWFYLATGSEDIPELRNGILSLNSQLEAIDNDLIKYKFDDFKHATHYSLVGKAIPSALESIFNIYRPITRKEYDEILLQTSISPNEYLTGKYEEILELYGLDMQIRLNDFMAVHNAIEKTRKWNEYKDLSKLAEKYYPNTMLATFFEARYEEETGNPKKAMKAYQKAYGKEKIAFLNVDYMLQRADQIKKDFNY